MIRLEPVNADNLDACISLAVAEEQRRFVAANVYSLAQAYLGGLTPLAVYHGETLVGFVMYGPDPDVEPERGAYCILRLMIDRAYQGRGYGRAALEETLRRLRAEPGCREILIGVHPENTVAVRLYGSLGFADSGLRWGKEHVYALRLSSR